MFFFLVHRDKVIFLCFCSCCTWRYLQKKANIKTRIFRQSTIRQWTDLYNYFGGGSSTKYNVDKWKGWWIEGTRNVYSCSICLQHSSFKLYILSKSVGQLLRFTINAIDCSYRKSKGLKDKWSERVIERGEGRQNRRKYNKTSMTQNNVL